MTNWWYDFLSRVAESVEGRSDDDRKLYIIDYWTDLEISGLLIIGALTTFNHMMNAHWIYLLLGCVWMFLCGLLLLIMQDWKAYLTTRRVLKQRIEGWVMQQFSILRRIYIRNRDKIIQRINYHREGPPPPPDHHRPSRSRDLPNLERVKEESGAEAMRRDLRDLFSAPNAIAPDAPNLDRPAPNAMAPDTPNLDRSRTTTRQSPRLLEMRRRQQQSPPTSPQ